MRLIARLLAGGCLVLHVLSTPAGAQPLSRLKGRVVSERGEAVPDAAVRIEAVSGFLGESYAGQRTYETKTDKKGEWALIGFKAGIWLFDASAPDRLPDAIALPITLIVASGSSLMDVTPSWHPILQTKAAPSTPTGQTLLMAADAARRGQRDEMTELLAPLQSSTDPDVLTAAGHICLLLRDASIARPFFQRALQEQPGSFDATLGMATTALMLRDYNAAARAFADARDRTKDKDARSYIAVAISELNKVHITFRAY